MPKSWPQSIIRKLGVVRHRADCKAADAVSQEVIERSREGGQGSQAVAEQSRERGEGKTRCNMIFI